MDVSLENIGGEIRSIHDDSEDQLMLKSQHVECFSKGGKARHHLASVVKYNVVLPVFIGYYPYGKITKQTVKNIAENRVYKMLTREDFSLERNNLQVDYNQEKVLHYIKNTLHIDTVYRWCLDYNNWRKDWEKECLQEYYNEMQVSNKRDFKYLHSKRSGIIYL